MHACPPYPVARALSGSRPVLVANAGSPCPRRRRRLRRRQRRQQEEPPRRRCWHKNKQGARMSCSCCIVSYRIAPCLFVSKKGVKIDPLVRPVRGAPLPSRLLCSSVVPERDTSRTLAPHMRCVACFTCVGVSWGDGCQLLAELSSRGWSVSRTRFSLPGRHRMDVPQACSLCADYHVASHYNSSRNLAVMYTIWG